MRKDVAFACEQFLVSERRACKLLGITRATYRYEPKPDRTVELQEDVMGVGTAEAATRLPSTARAARTAESARRRDTDLSAVSG